MSWFVLLAHTWDVTVSFHPKYLHQKFDHIFMYKFQAVFSVQKKEDDNKPD